MTCKDCYHYDVCEAYFGFIPARHCTQFKDKSTVLELPCKVGDTVYRIGASRCKLREEDRCDDYCDGWQYTDCWEGGYAVLESEFKMEDICRFDKTVFLTREEAEAALKAMEVNNG